MDKSGDFEAVEQPKSSQEQLIQPTFAFNFPLTETNLSFETTPGSADSDLKQLGSQGTVNTPNSTFLVESKTWTQRQTAQSSKPLETFEPSVDLDIRSNVHEKETSVMVPLLDEYDRTFTGNPCTSELTDGNDEQMSQELTNTRAPREHNVDNTEKTADECPICNELYESRGEHSVALLNCDHAVCQHCLAIMQNRAADPSRIQCPLCRQRTPLIEWEIHRMQEDTICSRSPVNSDHYTQIYQDEQLAQPATGIVSALEQRLRCRVESGVMCGCFRHPNWLVRLIRQMQHRNRCCYLTLLVVLNLAEISLLLLVFLPVIVLVLLFTLAK